MKSFHHIDLEPSLSTVDFIVKNNTVIIFDRNKEVTNDIPHPVLNTLMNWDSLVFKAPKVINSYAVTMIMKESAPLKVEHHECSLVTEILHLIFFSFFVSRHLTNQ